MDPLLAQTIDTMVLPRYNGEFYFGLFAFIFSILVAGYYVIDWVRFHYKEHGHVTLFWAAGFFLSFWFQIPFLIANAGLPVVVSQYHTLFSVMVPIAFLGVILIYRSLRSLTHSGSIALDLGLTIWFFGAAAYFGFFFNVGDIVSTYAPIVFAAAIFFFVLFTGILLTLISWYKQLDLHQYPRTGIGVVLLTGATLLQLASCVAAILSILALPPQLWFVALMSSATPYVLQSVGVLALAWAFYYVHQEQSPHPSRQE